MIVVDFNKLKQVVIETDLNKLVWPLWKKISCLFFCTYFLIYMLPFPLDFIPGIKSVILFFSNFLNEAILWTGNDVFKFNQLKKIPQNGSGDGLFEYVKILTFLIFSLIITVVVFGLKIKKINYPALYYWVKTYARYFVGTFMLEYGLLKFFEGQFSFPDFIKLEQPLGDFSPMGLLWTFMGYSKAYAVFSGLAECTGGFLLFFRRTTVLGSLVTLGVMANVVMMNFCYDVPVKIFSSHLFLITLFIITPDLKILFSFFVQGNNVSLPASPFHFKHKWIRTGRLFLKSIIISCILGFLLFESIVVLPRYNNQDSANILNGIYTTETYTRNNVVLPPLDSDTFRWRKLVLNNTHSKIVTMSDFTRRYEVVVDTNQRKLILKSQPQGNGLYTLDYQVLPGNYLSVSGYYNYDSIRVVLKKFRAAEDFLLVNRGFHWVNEYPFNR